LSEHWISASAPGPKDGKLDIRSVVLTKRPYTLAGVRGSVWWCGAAGQAVAQAKAGRLEPFDRGLPGASLPRCGGCAVWLRRDGSMLRVSDSSEAFAIR